MAASGYMDKLFGAGDHYRSVPASMATDDPSYEPEARIYASKRVPSPDANTYDPAREIATSYGITKKNGQEIGWMRVDNEGSHYDPNTSTTTAVDMNDTVPDIIIYTHVWARTYNDPLAATSSRKEVSLDKAKKLRREITMICSKPRQPR